MADNASQARIVPQKKWSNIWIVPLLALVIGLWMLFQYINNKGPEITLRLSTAEGIEEGKTPIKSLNVTVGVISEITLSENYDYIIARAQMDKEAARMLREDTLFWIVKPRIGAEGISGMETLLSGDYIQLQPGTSKTKANHYRVLDQPPVAPPDVKGIRIVLVHEKAEKLNVGDPVLFEGYTVGRVEQTSYDIESLTAHYQLFIFAPYDQLLRADSYFWQSSAVDMTLNSEGIQVKVDSLESLFRGGVNFSSLSERTGKSAPAKQMQKFQLFDDMDQVREGMYSQYVEYVMLFDESIRGLQPNAPVEYRGLRIGTVDQVPLRTQTEIRSLGSLRIPVLIRIEPGRLSEDVEEDISELKTVMEQEFRRGMRATLQTGNVLTGSLYIDTDYYHDKDTTGPAELDGYPVFPTRKGGFAEVQRQITDLLKTLNHLPLNQTLTSLNQTLAASRATLKSFDNTADSLKVLLAKKDTQSLPGDLHQTLEQVKNTLEGVNPDSGMYEKLESLLKEVEQVMTEFRPVLRQLNEKPDSLIFGEGYVKDSIPVKGVQ